MPSSIESDHDFDEYVPPFRAQLRQSSIARNRTRLCRIMAIPENCTEAVFKQNFIRHSKANHPDKVSDIGQLEGYKRFNRLYNTLRELKAEQRQDEPVEVAPPQVPVPPMPSAAPGSPPPPAPPPPPVNLPTVDSVFDQLTADPQVVRFAIFPEKVYRAVGPINHVRGTVPSRLVAALLFLEHMHGILKTGGFSYDYLSDIGHVLLTQFGTNDRCNIIRGLVALKVKDKFLLDLAFSEHVDFGRVCSKRSDKQSYVADWTASLYQSKKPVLCADVFQSYGLPNASLLVLRNSFPTHGAFNRPQPLSKTDKLPDVERTSETQMRKVFHDLAGRTHRVEDRRIYENDSLSPISDNFCCPLSWKESENAFPSHKYSCMDFVWYTAAELFQHLRCYHAQFTAETVMADCGWCGGMYPLHGDHMWNKAFWLNHLVDCHQAPKRYLYGSWEPLAGVRPFTGKLVKAAKEAGQSAALEQELTMDGVYELQKPVRARSANGEIMIVFYAKST